MFDPGAIPPELKYLPQWVAWRRKIRNSKPTKVPINPLTGGAASTTDPRTWSTFDVAVAFYARGRGDGVGFVFSPDDSCVGVDLDRCRDPQTRHIEPWAQEVITHLDSYAEISQSGCGVHVICRGSLPGGRRRGDIEMYDRARYFCMTGDHLPGTPAEIRDASAELDALYGELGGTSRSCPPIGETFTQASSATTPTVRGKALDLLDSTGPAGYVSPSEADAALAATLIRVGLTGSEALRVIIQSARGLDAQRRKGPHWLKYWERTIANAAAFVGSVVEWRGMRVRHLPVLRKPQGIPIPQPERPQGVPIPRVKLSEILGVPDAADESP